MSMPGLINFHHKKLSIVQKKAFKQSHNWPYLTKFFLQIQLTKLLRNYHGDYETVGNVIITKLVPTWIDTYTAQLTVIILDIFNKRVVIFFNSISINLFFKRRGFYNTFSSPSPTFPLESLMISSSLCQKTLCL